MRSGCRRSPTRSSPAVAAPGRRHRRAVVVGKTTFIQRPEVQLQVVGLEPVRISLDDYYVDRDASPRRRQRRPRLRGARGAAARPAWRPRRPPARRREEVQTAHYDFRAGVSHPAGGPRLQPARRPGADARGHPRPQPGDAAGAARDPGFSVSCARWRSCRLTNGGSRGLRRPPDLPVSSATATAANYDAAATIRRWPSVRDAESRAHLPVPAPRRRAVVDTLAGLRAQRAQRSTPSAILLEVPRDDPAWTTARAAAAAARSLHFTSTRARAADVDPARSSSAADPRRRAPPVSAERGAPGATPPRQAGLGGTSSQPARGRGAVATPETGAAQQASRSAATEAKRSSGRRASALSTRRAPAIGWDPP